MEDQRPMQREMSRRRFSFCRGESVFPQKLRAFSLVELVMVLVLVGIFAAFAISRFADRNAFAATGFASQLSATLQHARKTAVAMRRNVCVVLSTADTLTLTYNPVPAGDSFSCGTAPLPLSVPGSADNKLRAPSGVTLSVLPAGANTLAFNGLGKPLSGMTLNVSGSDGSMQSITVESESGFVH